jgi:hypothetical protein
MTQKALLQSAGDGTAVPTGYVGEHLEALATSVILGSTSAGVFTTITTLSNVPAGKWKLEFYSSLIDLSGQSGDTVTPAAGRIVTLAIFKNGSEIYRNYCAGLPKSTVNSGYLITSGSGYLIENKSTTDTYDLRFTTVNNSGTPSISQLSCSASLSVPAKLTATRIA